MRHHPTVSEAALWQQLRGGKLGVVFRRQVVIGDFIADFVAPAIRLVVEVDGGYHHRRSAQDQRRDEKLRRLGYRVLRLPEEVVLGDIRAAVEAVRGAGGREPAGVRSATPTA